MFVNMLLPALYVLKTNLTAHPHPDYLGLYLFLGVHGPSGNTTILTIIDRFSKADVFRLRGIPQDMVPNRGPQVVSCVWK